MNVIRTDKTLATGQSKKRSFTQLDAKTFFKYPYEGSAFGIRKPLAMETTVTATATATATTTTTTTTTTVATGFSNWNTLQTPAVVTRRRNRTVHSTSSILRSSSRKANSGSTNLGIRSSGCNSSNVDHSSIVLAITAGRGDARTEVGMAGIDLKYPRMILCQISDCQTYSNTLAKIYVFEPMEILMPDTMCVRVNDRNQLFRSIGEKFPGLEITGISRIHFNESNGLERVKTLCAKEYSSVELFLKEKYYALAATAALLKYVEFVQRIVYPPKSLKIEFEGSPNATVIDVESARSLELVTSQCGQRNASLLGVLDRCSTPMGKRLLRATVLQPPCEERTILERQTCVAELVSNRSLRLVLQPVIRRLFGADRLLTLSTQTLQNNSVQSSEQNLNYVLLLKNSLDVVPELGSILASSEARFFRTVRENLADPQFRLIGDKILQLIHPDARSVAGYTSSNMQRCFAIKAGINDLLDIARQTYCELIDDMKTMVEGLARKYKLALSLGCNASLGYHVQALLPRDSALRTSDLPVEFIEVRRNKSTLTMTTNALLVLGQQCKIACEELHLMSNVLLCDLLKNIRQYVGCLFQLSADVAELDVIISLARVSSSPGYVKPTFASRLNLKNSTHPVMEICGLDRPVPNDVTASIPRNFHTITGPNMSGKSTYLKQIVLLQIMAQIGCYVSSEKAEFRIADRIFCRICFRDDIECNASTFVLEIKELQYILRSVTPKSLVVLDELCRATTLEDGSSIAWAICERLLTSTAFTFAATHFACLANLATCYYNVTNHHFETINVPSSDPMDRRLTYTHRLRPGRAPIDNYGIALAELCGLPETVTEKARNYAAKFYEGTPTIENATESTTWEKRCYDLVAEIYEFVQIDGFHREDINRLVEGFDGGFAFEDLQNRSGKSVTDTLQNDEDDVASKGSIGSFPSPSSNIITDAHEGECAESALTSENTVTSREPISPLRSYGSSEFSYFGGIGRCSILPDESSTAARFEERCSVSPKSWNFTDHRTLSSFPFLSPNASFISGISDQFRGRSVLAATEPVTHIEGAYVFGVNESRPPDDTKPIGSAAQVPISIDISEHENQLL